MCSLKHNEFCSQWSRPNVHNWFEWAQSHLFRLCVPCWNHLRPPSKVWDGLGFTSRDIFCSSEDRTNSIWELSINICVKLSIPSHPTKYQGSLAWFPSDMSHRNKCSEEKRLHCDRMHTFAQVSSCSRVCLTCEHLTVPRSKCLAKWAKHVELPDVKFITNRAQSRFAQFSGKGLRMVKIAKEKKYDQPGPFVTNSLSFEKISPPPQDCSQTCSQFFTNFTKDSRNNTQRSTQMLGTNVQMDNLGVGRWHWRRTLCVWMYGILAQRQHPRQRRRQYLQCVISFCKTQFRQLFLPVRCWFGWVLSDFRTQGDLDK